MSCAGDSPLCIRTICLTGLQAETLTLDAMFMELARFERSALQSRNRLRYRNGWTHFFHEREKRDRANSRLQLG